MNAPAPQASGAINTDAFSAVLRERGVDPDTQRLAISRLTGSDQESDLTEPANCEGFGRVRHFTMSTATGWPANPLPIAPAAKALGLDSAPQTQTAQVFQNAICNWRCWYCFVDFPLLSGSSERSEMLSASQLFELYLGEQDRPSVIDLSGGQPDLVPEWVVWMSRERANRGLEDSVYLWSDDNLSNDYFWAKLSSEERRYLDGLPGYGKVCCFKGFNETSFAFNTGASKELFARQFDLMERLVRGTSLDLYCYATFTTPRTLNLEVEMADFVDRLQAIDRYLPLRLVPLQIGVFTPTKARAAELHQRALQTQEEAIAAWTEELSRRFTDEERGRAITEVELAR